MDDKRLFGLAVVAVLGLAAGFQLARWTAPDATASGPGGGTATVPHTHASQAGPDAQVGGLSLSAGGYALVPEQTVFPARAARVLRLRVTGPDGKPVTGFATVNDKPMHLIVTRRDLGGYQHLHPTLTPDGVWSTPLTLATPGPWRAVADFSVIGSSGSQTALTLGVDLTVAGGYAPSPIPAVSRESTVDGYVVTYEGTLRPSATLPLVFRVYRDGSLVSALDSYLGSLGHLVVLREGDVGYVHVHADPPTAQAETKFWLTAPSAGRYRMYFDFKVGGVVHTAGFTLRVS